MKKLVLVAVLLLGFSIVAVAQDYPKVEVFGGYSYFRMDTTTNFGAPSGEADLNMNGLDINVAVNGNKWLGFVADFSGAYGTLDTSYDYAPGVESWADISNYSIMIGPRVTLHRGKVTPFLQALIGIFTGKYSELGEDFTSNNLAMAFGGGLDINVNDRFAIRPAQVEYYTIREWPDRKLLR